MNECVPLLHLSSGMSDLPATLCFTEHGTLHSCHAIPAAVRRGILGAAEVEQQVSACCQPMHELDIARCSPCCMPALCASVLHAACCKPLCMPAKCACVLQATCCKFLPMLICCACVLQAACFISLNMHASNMSLYTSGLKLPACGESLRMLMYCACAADFK